MARTVQTARKSTGGRAPRRLIAEAPQSSSEVSPCLLHLESSRQQDITFQEGEEIDVSKHELALEAADLLELDIASATVRLGFGKTIEHSDDDDDDDDDHENRVNFMPHFDIDDPINQSRHMGQYEVQRRPAILRDSLDEPSKTLNKHIMEKHRKQFPKSSWVLVWENSDAEGNSILAQEQCKNGEYKELEEILKGGRLYGCELRGNAETAQCGLVATRKLQERTFVAVECGVLWSEPQHDAMLDKVGDPMIGLTSSMIAPSILESLADPAPWKKYKAESKTKYGTPYGGRAPGFVMDSSVRGNETKHIDDPGWTHVCEGDAQGVGAYKSNLESYVVLDLKRGLSTVAFETNRDVKNNEELTMDWGCWETISDVMLPGQAQISLLLKRRLDVLMTIAEQEGLSCGDNWPSSEGEKPFYFNAKRGIYESLEDYGDDCDYGADFELLQSLKSNDANTDFSIGTSGDAEWGKAAIGVVDDTFEGVLFAVCSRDFEKLSHSTRRKMTSVPVAADTNFSRVLKERLQKSYESGVEIVEIVDPKHPAKLFAIPGKKAYGVRAKKMFRKGAPVLVYGGTIEQYSPATDSTNPYIYDVQMPVEYQGPRLFIDGARSIGGKINDPWSPPGLAQREANLFVIVHWDGETNTPQLLFRASKLIKPGDELLYDYGKEYWKVMWTQLMRTHAMYATEANSRCKWIRSSIVGRMKNGGSISRDDLLKREKMLLKSSSD